MDAKCAILLTGNAREEAVKIIKANHYTHSVSSGKSHYLRWKNAFIVWSLPANKNIAKFLLGWPGNVWELSRLWAPDKHALNLLTEAIRFAVKAIRTLENPDALVSYADPSAGHKGGVYRAASWIYSGKSEESRAYRTATGQIVSRRSFHSGHVQLTKSEIIARGYAQFKLPGKERFVRLLSKRAKETYKH